MEDPEVKYYILWCRLLMAVTLWLVRTTVIIGLSRQIRPAVYCGIAHMDVVELHILWCRLVMAVTLCLAVVVSQAVSLVLLRQIHLAPCNGTKHTYLAHSL